MDSEYQDVAKVANVIDGYKCVINRGSNHDVRQGQNYLIFRLGGRIQDPDSGEDLGVLEIVLGRAKVVHVQEQICTLESTGKVRTPGTMRRIKRQGGTGLFGLAGGPSEEEIEEGLKVSMATMSVEIGDMARPV